MIHTYKSIKKKKFRQTANFLKNFMHNKYTFINIEILQAFYKWIPLNIQMATGILFEQYNGHIKHSASMKISIAVSWISSLLHYAVILGD